MPSTTESRKYLGIPGWLVFYRKDWVVPDIIAGLTAAAMVIPKSMAYTCVDVLRVHGVAAFQKDAAFSAFAVIGSSAVGCWAAGRLGDRWGRTRTTALAMILSGGCALVIGWSALPVAAVLVLGVVWGFSVWRLGAVFNDGD